MWSRLVIMIVNLSLHDDSNLSKLFLNVLHHDSSRIEDGDENAVDNESRIHEQVNVIERSSKFHETVKSESLSG